MCQAPSSRTKLNSTELTEQHLQHCHFLWSHGLALPQPLFCFPFQQRLGAPAQSRMGEAERILCGYLSPFAVPTMVTCCSLSEWMSKRGQVQHYSDKVTSRKDTDRWSVCNFLDPITTLK